MCLYKINWLHILCFRYFADVLNIIQGVYIFIIFVCKRDVFNVIFKKGTISNELDSTKDDSISSQYRTENVEMDSIDYVQRVRY